MQKLQIDFFENYLSPRDGFYDCDYMVWGKEFEKMKKYIPSQKRSFPKAVEKFAETRRSSRQKDIGLGNG